MLRKGSPRTQVREFCYAKNEKIETDALLFEIVVDFCLTILNKSIQDMKIVERN